MIPRQETITAGPPFLRDQVKVLFDKCPKMTSLYVHVTNWTWWKFDRSFEGAVERERILQKDAKSGSIISMIAIRMKGCEDASLEQIPFL